MITNRWQCNRCAKMTETDGEMRPTAPNNPPRECVHCEQSQYGFHHLGSFLNGHQIVSEVVSERIISPDQDK